MSLQESRRNLTKPVEIGAFRRDWKQLPVLATVLLASFLVYLPSLNNGFVNWDDQANIYQNPHIINITNLESFFVSVQGIFSTDVYGNYNPLSIASFAVEKLLFGLENPGWFHLNNILLHLVCVFLVFHIARALGLKLIPAAFCALLFGIQPMRVESVAWVTERKDVLYGAFYFLALYYYIESVRTTFNKRYSAVILISFVLALLSKIQAVALPLSMLLVDYYFDRKPGLKLLGEKWLYFFLSLATGLLGIYFLRADGGIQNNYLFSFFERLFIGGYGYSVYLVKSLVPYQMVPVYPYPAALDWTFYASIIPVLGIFGLIYYCFVKKKRVIVFGLLFFTVNIMFMLQILGAGQGFISDRFTYVAYFGLFFSYSFWMQCLLDKQRNVGWLIYLVAGLIFAAYGYSNYQQNKIWQNGETLWSHVLDHYPRSSLVWENRADYYQQQGRREEAVHDFSQALVLKPDNPLAYYRRGQLYFAAGEPEKLPLALQDYSRAIQLAPNTSVYFISRAVTYLQLNLPEKAINDLQAAERLEPNNRDIYFHRSSAHFKLGQYDEAKTDLAAYLRLNPDNPSMWSNLGTVNRMKKDYAQALNAFNQAIQLEPGKLDHYYKRSITYFEMGDKEHARSDLKFLRANGFQAINPDFEKLIMPSQ